MRHPWALAGSVAVTAFLTACGGGDPGTAPPPPTPATVTTIEVTPAAPTVVQWDSLALTATVKDQRGVAMSGKTVTWSSSAEAVATVSASGVVAALTPGTATITATAEGKSGSTAVTVTAAVPQAPLRLVVEPGALLLPGVGATAPLQAVIVDARSRRFPVAATYALSRTGVVTVNAAGVATAAATGSVQVTASAQGLTAPPVLVLVATPAPTVTLVPDSAVVGGITPVSLTGPVQAGWRYRVRLKGAAPAVGARLVGSGSAPLAGQVVSVTPEAGLQLVTLEVRPLRELLPDLTVNERLPVSPAAAVLNPALRSGYRLETSATTIRLVPTGAGVLWPGPLPNASGGWWSPRPAAFDSTKFTLGPFECEAKVTILPKFSLPFPDITFTPQLALDMAVEAGQLTRLVLEGNVLTSLTLKPRLENAYSGEASCTKPDITKLPLPLSGPLGLLAGVKVPLGAGFDLTGSVTIAQFGMDLTLAARPTLQVGLECVGGACAPRTTLTGNPEMQVKWVLPDLGGQFRVNLETWAYGMASLEIGSGPVDPWDLIGNLSLAKARFGASQTVDWAPMTVQVADTTYASSYRLSLKGEVAPGESAENLVTFLRETLSLPSAVTIPKLEPSVSLARSPSGRITAAPASAAPGDSVTYLVTLDTASYLGSYGLDSLILQRRRSTPTGGVTLDTLAGPCNRIPPQVGRELFQCKAAYADTGTVDVHAFVRPRLYGVTMPTWLEIADNARARTGVGVAPKVTITLPTVGTTGALLKGLYSIEPASVRWFRAGDNYVKLDGSIMFNGRDESEIDAFALVETPSKGVTRLRGDMDYLRVDVSRGGSGSGVVNGFVVRVEVENAPVRWSASTFRCNTNAESGSAVALMSFGGIVSVGCDGTAAQAATPSGILQPGVYSLIINGSVSAALSANSSTGNASSYVETYFTIDFRP